MGGGIEAEKSVVSKQNHPHLSIFGRSKTRGKKGGVAHGITTFEETRIRKKKKQNKKNRNYIIKMISQSGVDQ